MIFLDTNIFVYAIDPRDEAKHRAARSLIKSARYSDEYLISAQVLNEFSHVALRKLGMTQEETRQFVTMFGAIRSVAVHPSWTVRALEIMGLYSLQFYDSLLLAAAEANGCEQFLSEDLGHGQIYCGVKVVNPFSKERNENENQDDGMGCV